MADVLPKLEQNLKAVTEKRDATRALITKMQEELTQLFSGSPKRPRGSMGEIEKNLDDLEKKRTRTSLSLTEEKVLLKQINAGERDKRALQERINHDKKIDARKAQVQELRNALKPLTDSVADLEKQITKAKLAKKLGCTVEEMQKTVMECPAEKIGKVIGKSGATIKKIEEKAGVSLDVDTNKHTIVINGSEASFEIAKAEITKIILSTEEDVDIPSELNFYLATNTNGVMDTLRKQHPDVYIDVARNTKKIIMRGQPDELEKLKESLRNLGVVKKEKELIPAEAVTVIGKKGATIAKITTQHKTAIEIKKQSDELSLAIVAGPEAAVDAAMQEIEDLIEFNKEVIKSIPCSKTIVQGFLTAGGVRIKELQKKINESTRELNAGIVMINFDKPSGDNSTLIIKGKNAAIGTAVAMVGEAIRELDTSTVRIMADRHAIPQIIGKGGENIRKLREGKKVNIEVDKKSGEIAINGLSQEEVAEVEAKVLEIINENKVLKIPVDPALIEIQYRDMVRSKTRNEVTELARLDLDKPENNILLRGTDENVNKAAEIVKTYLENNYFESIQITDGDRDALLAGGQKSKIVSFAKELEVNLSADREKSTLQARGTIEKVKAAVKTISAYLFGGEGKMCCTIPVAEEAIGIVIGKGGKVRKTLETKYAGCSIYIHRSNDAITIRGPEEPATGMRFEVLKMIGSARITQTVSATEEQMQVLNKSNLVRRLTQNIPVQCTMEDTTIKVRGVEPDVKDAVALLNEHLTGVYTSNMELGSSQFSKLKAASRDESHFARIKTSSGAEVSLDDSKNAVVVSGKKNNVKKAKVALQTFLDFLVPGEFNKIKLPKPMLATVGQSTGLIAIATSTGATVCLDRDLGMIIIQSSDKDQVAEASKLVQAKVSEAEKLVYVFEFDTTEAWLIPMLIGKGGSNVNSIRKQSGCTIDISKEERTVVVSGSDEESVAKGRGSVEASLQTFKEQNAFVEVPSDAMARFVGKGGAHITKLRNEYAVEIETLRKGSTKVKITGDGERVQACVDAIAAWVDEWAKPEEKKEVQIQRHHIAPILGQKGANIQSLQDELGCRIDLDRENLLVSFRGDPVKQELALRKIEEIMAENPEPERPVRTQLKKEDEEEKTGETAETPKKIEEPQKKAEMVDPDEQVDRSGEFPSLPIGLAAAPKNKRRRNRKSKAAAMGSPQKSVAVSSADETSESDEDDKIKAREPTLGPMLVNVGA